MHKEDLILAVESVLLGLKMYAIPAVISHEHEGSYNSYPREMLIVNIQTYPRNKITYAYTVCNKRNQEPIEHTYIKCTSSKWTTYNI
jgi:hypothetical protein